MGNTIALLDDEPERIALMEPLLRDRFTQYDIATFDNGPDMIPWLETHLSDVALIWPAVEAYDDLPAVQRNAMQARRALAQSDLFVRGWLTKVDPKSGLIPENLSRGVEHWNGRNNGADNYALMVLTAAIIDRGAFNGQLLDMLKAEQRLTNRVDRLGDYYKFSTAAFESSRVGQSEPPSFVCTDQTQSSCLLNRESEQTKRRPTRRLAPLHGGSTFVV